MSETYIASGSDLLNEYLAQWNKGNRYVALGPDGEGRYYARTRWHAALERFEQGAGGVLGHHGEDIFVLSSEIMTAAMDALGVDEHGCAALCDAIARAHAARRRTG